MPLPSFFRPFSEDFDVIVYGNYTVGKTFYLTSYLVIFVLEAIYDYLFYGWICAFIILLPWSVEILPSDYYYVDDFYQTF